MPLLAIDTHHASALIDLTDVEDSTWASIWRAQTGDRLRCRSCDGPVIAKRMERSGLRFFAHRQLTPDCPAHGESARHLHLKTRFASAFRSSGWTAEPEVAGNGWRADVLATAPDGRRLAVEVQLSAMSHAEAADRAARHAASGVETVWVVEKRRDWARGMRTVLVGPDDRVVETVVIADAVAGCVLAPPASISRFVERLAQGRFTPIADPDGLFARAFYAAPARTLLQLDGCVDAWLPSLASKQRRQDAIARAAESRTRAAGAKKRARDEEMLASLHACRSWFARHSDLGMWFGPHHWRDPEDAVAHHWDPEQGIVVYVGTAGRLWLLAVAEPRRWSPRTSPLVGAWTNCRAHSAAVARYPVVYTPETELLVGELTLKRAQRQVPRSYRRHLQSDVVRLRTRAGS